MSVGKRGKALLQAVKYVVFVLALIGFMVWAGGFLHSKVPPGTVAHQPGEALSGGETLHTLAMESIPAAIEVIGTAVSERNIQLSARINAYVDEVLVSAGDAVTNGQPLIVLDSREIEEQYTAAEAQFREASQDYERTQRLMEREASTEKALDMAEARFTASQAQLDQIKVMRTYARIISPLDGMVADRRIEAGDLAAPGTVLVTVYDPDNMRLEVPVPIRLVNSVALGQDLEVVMDYPQRTITGTVTEIVGEIDPSSRTRTVKVHLSEGYRALPGTFGRLRIVQDERPALLLPAAAVQRTGQLETVGVVREDRVVQRLIKTVAAPDGRLEVISGLEEGDQVVIPAAVEARHEA